MSRRIPPAYKTTNWPAYNEALKRRGSLTLWFDPEMIWEAAPSGKRGRHDPTKALAVNIPYRGANGPLRLLIDSTGIKVEGEGEWNARKHGGPKRRVWRKIPLGIDEQMLEVRAVEITGSHIGDAPVLPDLLSQIPASKEIGSVTADGANDTRKCHDAIANRGAHAVTPPRKNAKPRKADTAVA